MTSSVPTPARKTYRSTWGNSQVPSGTPATPPIRNGTVRRRTKPRRTVPMDRICPNHEPHTTNGPASCGSIVHAHTLTATSPNAKPDTPCTKPRSEEHTSELQSRLHLVCRLL